MYLSIQNRFMFLFLENEFPKSVHIKKKTTSFESFYNIIKNTNIQYTEHTHIHVEKLS